MRIKREQVAKCEEQIQAQLKNCKYFKTKIKDWSVH